MHSLFRDEPTEENDEWTTLDLSDRRDVVELCDVDAVRDVHRRASVLRLEDVSKLLRNHDRRIRGRGRYACTDSEDCARGRAPLLALPVEALDRHDAWGTREARDDGEQSGPGCM